jgi:hypothetical protein
MKKVMVTILLMAMAAGSAFGQEAVAPEQNDDGYYLIETWQNLYWIGQDAARLSLAYLQTADIDLAEADPPVSEWNDGQGWYPFGTFTGLYDGKGYVIKNLYINREAGYQALFFRLEGRLYNLGVVDADVTAGTYVSALVAVNLGTVMNCYATGTVTGTDMVGGLVARCGSTNHQGKIYNSWSSVNVFATKNAGGLIGEIVNNGTYCENSYSRGDVTRLAGATDTTFGGFVGSATYSARISCSYSTGKVIYEDADNPVNKGFVGIESGSYFDSNFWDMESSEQSSTGGEPGEYATGKSSTELKELSTYLNAGYNFDGVWKIDANENDGYADLQFNLLPILHFGTASAITANSAKLSANWEIRGDFGVSSYGFILDTLPYPRIDEGHHLMKIDLGAPIPHYYGFFSDTAYGLEKNTTYHFRAYATNDAGTSYTLPDDNDRFTTDPMIAVQPEGSGDSEDDPYLISTAENLYWVHLEIKNQNRFTDKYLRQNDHIDLSETQTWFLVSGDESYYQGWEPIGGLYGYFEGVYDGSGYSISNIYIHRPDQDRVGLFTMLNPSGLIKNLHLVDAFVVGKEYVGGIIGISNAGRIENCSISGMVAGVKNVGGIVGTSYGPVVSSSTTGTVGGMETVGGLAGSLYSNDVRDSYSRSDVTRYEGSDNQQIGAFAGYSAVIVNSYATGKVFFEGTDDPADKGFVGEASTSGIEGMSGNFWDTESSNQSSAIGAEGKTTAEMTDVNTFQTAAWDLDSTWALDSGVNDGYPHHQWAAAGPVSIDDKKPVENWLSADSYILERSYPNPFNASFTIPFTLKQTMEVKLKLYDISGRQVMQILNEKLSSGSYHFQVNANSLSSGVYILKINLGQNAHTQKLVLLK